MKLHLVFSFPKENRRQQKITHEEQSTFIFHFYKWSDHPATLARAVRFPHQGW